MSVVRVGVIGAGAIAKDHCGKIKAYNGAELVAVADLSGERRLEIKKEYGMARDYEKWQDLVKDPEIDAVVNALPNSLHAPVSIAALEAGKHVMLDKPFAMNYAEAAQVAAAAKRKRKIMMVGMNQRFSNDAHALRAMVKRGDLGEVFHTKTSWCRRMGSPKFGTWFVSKKLAGGGCMLDIGVHALDLALYVIDRWDPVAVSGQVYGKFGHRGIGEGGWGKSDRDKKLVFDVEDSAFGLLKFRNGASLELNVSWVLHQEQNDRRNIELFGTEAGASLFPFKLFRSSKNQGEYEVVAPQNVKLEHAYTNRQANWLDAITGKDKPLCTVEQALVAQKIIDAIYLSSRSGREVRIAKKG